jgi:hypothetical protein
MTPKQRHFPRKCVPLRRSVRFCAARRCMSLAFRASIHACLPGPICSHSPARRCIFLARTASIGTHSAAHRCIFLASRAGIHACLPGPIGSRASARRCIFLARSAARRCICLASRVGIHACLRASIGTHAAAHRCIFLASRAGIHACLPAPIGIHAAAHRCQGNNRNRKGTNRILRRLGGGRGGLCWEGGGGRHCVVRARERGAAEAGGPCSGRKGLLSKPPQTKKNAGASAGAEHPEGGLPGSFCWQAAPQKNYRGRQRNPLPPKKIRTWTRVTGPSSSRLP